METRVLCPSFVFELGLVSSVKSISLFEEHAVINTYLFVKAWFLVITGGFFNINTFVIGVVVNIYPLT